MPIAFGSPEATEVLEKDKEIFGEWRLQEISKDELVTCPECDGEGSIEEECPECGNVNDVECFYCDGAGEVKLQDVITDKLRRETLKVRLRKANKS